MFDGLKDKLGSFREEAEEAAEENAEPVEEDEDFDDDDGALEAGGDAERAGAVDAEATDERSAESDPSESVGTAPEADAAETDSDAVSNAAATDTSEAVDDGTADDDTVAADDSVAAGDDASATADEGAANGGATTASADVAVEDDAPETDVPETDDTADEADEAARSDDTADTTAEETDDADVGDGPTIVYADEDASTDEDADAEEGDPETDDDTTSLTKKAKSFTRGKFVIEEEDLEGPLQDLEMALLAGDVEMEVAQELTDRIREELVGETRTFTTGTGEVVEDALRSALLDVVSVGQFDFDRRVAEAEKPVVIVFTGVNGVGKTTSIAKLVRYFEERGLDSVVANGDTFRAGANEQIEEHADALDTKLIAHEQGGDPAAVIYDGVEYAEAHDVDVVLGDTAGRLHTSEGLMDQLAKIDRVVDPDLTIFVDEAVAGQDAVNRAREFDDAAAIDGSILTKADADASGGAAISIAQVTGKPILFLGTGQAYDDLERFDPEWLVDQLLEA